MPRGSKAKYSAKQKRMAEHIEEGYEDRGVGKDTAESRAWATVNAQTGGGERGRSGSRGGRPGARKKAGRKTAARKSTGRKTTGRKSAGRKTASRKTAARTTAGRTSARRKSAGRRKTSRTKK